MKFNIISGIWWLTALTVWTSGCAPQLEAPVSTRIATRFERESYATREVFGRDFASHAPTKVLSVSIPLSILDLEQQDIDQPDRTKLLWSLLCAPQGQQEFILQELRKWTEKDGDKGFLCATCLAIALAGDNGYQVLLDLIVQGSDNAALAASSALAVVRPSRKHLRRRLVSQLHDLSVSEDLSSRKFAAVTMAIDSLNKP